MTTNPDFGWEELQAGQGNAEAALNLMLRILSAASGVFTVERVDLTAPPGSEPDGAIYMLAGGAGTGDWAGFNQWDLVMAKGASAVNGWKQIVPKERWLVWDKNQSRFYYFNDSSGQWVQQSVTDITDGTGGSASDTLNTVTGSGADAAINDNFASLAAKVNAIHAVVNNIGFTFSA